jgi:hypothetical protein
MKDAGLFGPEGTRAGLAKWLPENAAAAAPKASPREEFADVLRELGGNLTGEHPIMDGRSHRMVTLDDDRGEKSMFYVAHSDGRPAGYARTIALAKNSVGRRPRLPYARAVYGDRARQSCRA